MERISKEKKDKLMKIVRKASSNEYETTWKDGAPISKNKSEIKKGKLSRARGARFELKVRDDLEKDGWFLDKWNNNVNLEEGKLIKAKRKYNPYKKMLVVGTGFPDFVAFRRKDEENFEVIGIESKINGTLSKVEKEKCSWYLQNKVFSKILIARAVREGRKINIEYIDFEKRFPKFLDKNK